MKPIYFVLVSIACVLALGVFLLNPFQTGCIVPADVSQANAVGWAIQEAAHSYSLANNGTYPQSINALIKANYLISDFDQSTKGMDIQYFEPPKNAPHTQVLVKISTKKNIFTFDIDGNRKVIEKDKS